MLKQHPQNEGARQPEIAVKGIDLKATLEIYHQRSGGLQGCDADYVSVMWELMAVFYMLMSWRHAPPGHPQVQNGACLSYKVYKPGPDQSSI